MERGKKSRWSREDSIKRENKSPSPVEIVFEKPPVVEAVFGKPPPKNSKSICPRCLGSGHREEQCWSIKNVCRVCGVVGHVEEVHDGEQDFCPRCGYFNPDHPVDKCKSLDLECGRCGVRGHVKRVHSVQDESLRRLITKSLGYDLFGTSFCPRCTRSGHKEHRCPSFINKFKCRKCGLIGHYKEVHSVTDENLRKVIIAVLGCDLWDEENNPRIDKRTKASVCHRCARSGHSDDQCRSLFKTCGTCGMVGHFEGVHEVSHIGFRQDITKALGMDLWEGSSKMMTIVGYQDDDDSKPARSDRQKSPDGPQAAPKAPPPPSLSALKNRGAHISTSVPPPSLKFLSSILEDPLARAGSSSATPHSNPSSSLAATYSDPSSSLAATYSNPSSSLAATYSYPSSSLATSYSNPISGLPAGSMSYPPVYQGSSSLVAPVYDAGSASMAPQYYAGSTQSAPQYNVSSPVFPEQYAGSATTASQYYSGSSSAAPQYNVSSPVVPAQYAESTPASPWYKVSSQVATTQYAPVANQYKYSSSSMGSLPHSSSNIAASLNASNSRKAAPALSARSSSTGPVLLDGTGSFKPTASSSKAAPVVLDGTGSFNPMKGYESRIKNPSAGLLGACPKSVQVPSCVWKAVPVPDMPKSKKNKTKSGVLRAVPVLAMPKKKKNAKRLSLTEKLHVSRLKETENEKRREEALKAFLKRRENELKKEQRIKDQIEEDELILSEDEDFGAELILSEDEDFRVEELGQSCHNPKGIEDEEKMRRLLELTKEEKILGCAIEEENRRKAFWQEEDDVVYELKAREIADREKILAFEEERLRQVELDLVRREYLELNSRAEKEDDVGKQRRLNNQNKPDLKVEIQNKKAASRRLGRDRIIRLKEPDLKIDARNHINQRELNKHQEQDLKEQLDLEAKLSLQRSRSSRSRSPAVELPKLSRRQMQKRSAIVRLGGKGDVKSRLGGNLASTSAIPSGVSKKRPGKSRGRKRNKRNKNLENEDRARQVDDDYETISDEDSNQDDEIFRQQERDHERALKEKLLRGERSKDEN